MANGCGMTGIFSTLWRLTTGSLPAFNHCCNDHDYGYAQVITRQDREQRDYEIRACIEAEGWNKTAVVTFKVLRKVGWIAIIVRDMRRYFEWSAFTKN